MQFPAPLAVQMRSLTLGTLVLLLAATSASAQLPLVTQAPPRVDVITSDAWLCRQVATNLEESTLLGSAILGRLERAQPNASTPF